MNTTSVPASAASEPGQVKAGRFGRWGKRLGIASFFFFLGKGLLWLIIPAWLIVERGCAGQ